MHAKSCIFDDPCLLHNLSTMTSFLSEVKAVLLEQGLGKARTTILAKQLEKYGGTATKALSEASTHVLVGNNTRRERVPVLLKTDVPDTVPVVRADWLSSCLAKRQLVPEEGYLVLPGSPVKAQGPPAHAQGTAQAQEAHSSPAKTSIQSSVQTKAEGGGTSDDTAAVQDMLSPKAGMFGVSTRQWKRSPGKNKRDPAAGWESSDSDYVESEEEEVAERKESNNIVRLYRVNEFLKPAHYAYKVTQCIDTVSFSWLMFLLFSTCIMWPKHQHL